MGLTRCGYWYGCAHGFSWMSCLYKSYAWMKSFVILTWLSTINLSLNHAYAYGTEMNAHQNENTWLLSNADIVTTVPIVFCLTYMYVHLWYELYHVSCKFDRARSIHDAMSLWRVVLNWQCFFVFFLQRIDMTVPMVFRRCHVCTSPVHEWNHLGCWFGWARPTWSNPSLLTYVRNNHLDFIMLISWRLCS
jgi:hypothetical protein